MREKQQQNNIYLGIYRLQCCSVVVFIFCVRQLIASVSIAHTTARSNVSLLCHELTNTLCQHTWCVNSWLLLLFMRFMHACFSCRSVCIYCFLFSRSTAANKMRVFLFLFGWYVIHCYRGIDRLCAEKTCLNQRNVIFSMSNENSTKSEAQNIPGMQLPFDVDAFAYSIVLFLIFHNGYEPGHFDEFLLLCLQGWIY